MSLNNISREKAGNNTTPIRQTRSQKRLEARLAPQQKAAAAVSQMVCVSYNTIAIVTPEGRVVTHGMPKPLKQTVESWTDIKQIAMHINPHAQFETVYVVGLKKNGTVVFTGTNSDAPVQVASWRNITQIAAGYQNIIGLDASGKVHATGDPSADQLKVDSWRDIHKVLAATQRTVGVKADGGICSCGKKGYGNDAVSLARHAGKKIADVIFDAKKIGDLYALTSEGTVFSPWDEQGGRLPWQNIIAIAPGVIDGGRILAITEDGHVKMDGFEAFPAKYADVQNWENMAYVTGGGAENHNNTIVGITRDGYIKVAGSEDCSEFANLRLFRNYMTIEADQLQAALDATEQRIQSLNQEIGSLEQQAATVKGLFANSKKARIQEKLTALHTSLTEAEAARKSLKEKLEAIGTSETEEPTENGLDDPELNRIFKPIFDHNTSLKQLLTGLDSDADAMTFEMLCQKEYIVAKDDVVENPEEWIAKLGEHSPCLIALSIQETEAFHFTFYSVCIDLFCAKRYTYLGDSKIRPYEIASALHAAINHQVDVDEKEVKFNSISNEVLSDEVELYAIRYDTPHFYSADDEDEDTETDDPNIIDYYQNNFAQYIQNVFEVDAVRSSLFIRGVSGSHLSVDELMQQGYIRFSSLMSTADNEKNVFAIVQLTQTTSPYLEISICASGHTDDISDGRAANAASTAIIDAMHQQNGLPLEMQNGGAAGANTYITMMAFALPDTDEKLIASELPKKKAYQIYTDVDVLKKIQAIHGDQELTFSAVGITADLIHTAWHLSLYLDNERQRQDFYMFVRNISGHYDYACPDVHVSIVDQVPKTSFHRMFSDGQFIGSCYPYMMHLNTYLTQQGIFAQYADINPETDGILVSLKGDEICTELVGGKTRPDLLCLSQTGQSFMGRPYPDELSV